MGNEQSTSIKSTEQIIAENEFLRQLCGPVGSITSTTEFWHVEKAKKPLGELSKLINQSRLVSHATNIPLSLFNPYLLDESLRLHAKNLCKCHSVCLFVDPFFFCFC